MICRSLAATCSCVSWIASREIDRKSTRHSNLGLDLDLLISIGHREYWYLAAEV